MASTDTIQLLTKLCACITDEMKINQDFACKVDSILGTSSNTPRAKRSNRRNPAKINPIQMIIDEDESVTEKLNALTIEELKDVIAEHGMDNAKLAMKWKNKERLVEFIIDTAQRRSKKGDAFRG